MHLHVHATVHPCLRPVCLRLTLSSLLKFIFMVNLMEYSVTISLHNSTQNVQVQGASTMPDGSKGAIFILNNYLADLFKTRSKEQKENVLAFNTALSQLGRKRAEQQQQSQQQLPPNLCAVCSGDMLKHNSKAMPCPNLMCMARMHSKCFRKHNCPYSVFPAISGIGAKKRPLAMTSFITNDEETPSPPQPGPPTTVIPSLSSLIRHITTSTPAMTPINSSTVSPAVPQPTSSVAALPPSFIFHTQPGLLEHS